MGYKETTLLEKKIQLKGKIIERLNLGKKKYIIKKSLLFLGIN